MIHPNCTCHNCRRKARTIRFVAFLSIFTIVMTAFYIQQDLIKKETFKVQRFNASALAETK